ncbi:hypothetical protein CHCC20375_1723 [Bacillus licheniformis]|nr:hypothetical protein CHCC20375_1723 [Bacillus licheniformis]
MYVHPLFYVDFQIDCPESLRRKVCFISRVFPIAPSQRTEKAIIFRVQAPSR